ncbi:MAG TPA: DinB family protein [Nitrolancea sp.]|nr:DinB family protein [Nitrolancea sp.]
MSQVATQLADQLEAVTNEFIEVVASLTPEQWARPTESEEWTIGVVAHHVAVGYPGCGELVQALAAGIQEIPPISADQLHTGNAKHAREFADAGQTETLELLRRGGAALVQEIRDLSDEQLNVTSGIFFGGEMSVRQVIERIVIGHPVSHLASIRATLGDSAQAAG